MRPIATDGVTWCVHVFVCHFVSPVKTAELIEMPFRAGVTRVGLVNHVLDGVEIPSRAQSLVRRTQQKKSITASTRNRQPRRDCGNRLQCSKLGSVALRCAPPWKNLHHAMQHFVKILWPLVNS